ncbi:MAG: hypothetical protein VB017_01315 [Endomicrobiaceae bacterium]|jgi:hypothetical protein|nr:hypothetical protein [Endomicrobiaceae bacterium]
MELAIETKLYNRYVFKQKIDRIYFADAFCQNLIPSKKELEKAFKSSLDNGLQFTLNTPYVTNSGIKKILDNVEFLSKHTDFFEVVFNDWGIFYEIKKRFPKINLILGRLLTKQRTDPNAFPIIANQQKYDYIAQKYPKKLPKTMYTHFQGSVINDKLFQTYLVKNKIQRVELEYLLWKMKIQLRYKIKASVYYPYAHITTTRNCGLLNMTYSKCNKMCNDTIIKYDDKNMYSPYFAIGNTVYYKITDISKLNEYNNTIDRLVFNDFEAYLKFNSLP